MSRAQDEGLLTRWSRRKQQSALESQQEDLGRESRTQEPANQDINLPDGAEHEATGELEEVPVLTDADMPPVDTLTEESDFSGFMSSGVSDELRNLALRKLFSAPTFNIRDGLDEYDEDYTYFEKLGDIVTADMKHQIELKEAAKQKLQTEEEQADEPVSETVAPDEEDSEQDESQRPLATGDDNIPKSDPPVSEPGLEQQESKTSQSAEELSKHHD